MKRIYIVIGLVLNILIVSAQTDLNVNPEYNPSRGKLGGRCDFNYLKLENHPDDSGVPLGGIGVGNVQYAPSGRFVRVGINNIHEPIRKTTASFFLVWYSNKSGAEAKRLVRDEQQQFGMEGVNNTYYTGLFPTAELSFGNSLGDLDVHVHAYSSLIPHDVKNSSLPVVFFDVDVEGQSDGEVSVAFAWEDLIGRGIKDVTAENMVKMDGQIFPGKYIQERYEMFDAWTWPHIKLVPTFSEKWSKNGMQGVRQFSTSPFIPRKATFQNYVNEVALLAEPNGDMQLSILPAYDIYGTGEAWNSFKKNGTFDASNELQFLSIPDKRSGGSAVALKTHLKAGEKKTFRFMLAWYYPELKIDHENAPAGSYWAGCSDYGRYFHKYFDSLGQLIDYGLHNRERNLAKTKEWQLPVLRSTYPDWYKFKLINSAYVIYTNMVLNKKGDVYVNEGGMGGLGGTMDQRISAHPFYQKFFTQLDRSEMNIFAYSQNANGSINHFIGHYYVGMGTVGGRIPTEGDWMIDNTGGWIIQLAKDYEQTGDIRYLNAHVGKVRDGMAFLKTLMPKGVEIPVGPTTYDDFKHPPIYSYGAGIYLTTLKAATRIMNAVGDAEMAMEYEKQYERTRHDMLRLLWNGRFFSYGCELDGSKRLDNILFTGQLGGQFVSRYCGWGDVIPMDMVKASLISQFKISLAKTPDFYANKVWDIEKNMGIDQENSQCWPFYLESYTGFTALQAGFVEDAMEIMKHIQLVHLRKGWTWCINLWIPDPQSYMTAPVTWFSTDIFAGAGLNVPNEELRLAPIITGKEKVIMPLFYPSFWADVIIEPKKRKLSLEIIKTFGDNVVALSTIVSEPNGKSAADAKRISIPRFEIKEGRKLDLSTHWDSIIQENDMESVLLDPQKTHFMHVDY